MEMQAGDVTEIEDGRGEDVGRMINYSVDRGKVCLRRREAACVQSPRC